MPFGTFIHQKFRMVFRCRITLEAITPIFKPSLFIVSIFIFSSDESSVPRDIFSWKEILLTLSLVVFMSPIVEMLAAQQSKTYMYVPISMKRRDVHYYLY